ncbi:DUF4097 family beta strand repeat-containing protein [Streptomyces sp. NPDC001668]|uniref:DUF4097 family beta strand repeat-containing protein n=1 Tax=Streptomyces sp. NPDC001668 TaxID=3364598 RepID=UPI00368F5403
MSTQRTFTAAVDGPVSIGVMSGIGEVRVTVDSTAVRATAAVSTGAPDGPLAKAVRDATSINETGDGQPRMYVEIPDVAARVVRSGGSTYNFAGRVAVSDVTVGSVRKSVFTVSSAGECDSRDTDTITVHVTVPPDSSVVLDTKSANLRVDGDLHVLGFRTVSGSVTADGVNILVGGTASGAVTAGHVKSAAKVKTESGDVTVNAYSGDSLEVETGSGTVEVTATTQACGPAAITTVSSIALVHGATRLDLQGQSVTGRVVPL